MTEKTCYFCDEPAPKPHGIHGCDEFDLCRSCRTKFVTIRFFADPNQQNVLGFVCSNCGFACDVPGRMKLNTETGEFEIQVDTQHNFCQSCGEPSKPEA